jgi:hypothetical protein
MRQLLIKPDGGAIKEVRDEERVLGTPNLK